MIHVEYGLNQYSLLGQKKMIFKKDNKYFNI